VRSRDCCGLLAPGPVCVLGRNLKSETKNDCRSEIPMPDNVRQNRGSYGDPTFLKFDGGPFSNR
jgi:hypothetical protein